jgi:hypothetical protein
MGDIVIPSEMVTWEKGKIQMEDLFGEYMTLDCSFDAQLAASTTTTSAL